jgi:hypothetical protein
MQFFSLLYFSSTVPAIGIHSPVTRNHVPPDAGSLDRPSTITGTRVFSLGSLVGIWLALGSYLIQFKGLGETLEYVVNSEMA